MKHCIISIILTALIFVAAGCQPQGTPSDPPAKDSSTTTTTVTDTNTAKLVPGKVLLLGDAVKYTAPLLDDNPAHELCNGQLLFEKWTGDESLYYAYSLVDKELRALGGTPQLRVGSGQNIFSQDHRYYYTGYITEENIFELRLYRVDLLEKTTTLIEKKPHGCFLFLLHEENGRIWYLWSEDLKGDGTDLSRRIECLNTNTGEITLLMETPAGSKRGINHACVADGVIYALVYNHADEENPYYTMETCSLDGESPQTYDLSFLNEHLVNREAIWNIGVGGEYVFFNTSLAGRSVVLKKTEDAYQLSNYFSNLLDDKYADKFAYCPPSSHRGFGHVYTSKGGILFDYDEEAEHFAKYTFPTDCQYLMFDENGHLVLVYKEEDQGVYYVFNDISY